MVVLGHERHVFIWDGVVHIEKVALVVFRELVSGLLLTHLAVGRLNNPVFGWRLDCFLKDFFFGFKLHTDSDVPCCDLGALTGL